MLGKLLLTAAFVGFGGAAQAQSTCPTIVQGAVLTAGQWNQCFSAKQDGLGYTPVNKGGDTMAGRLVAQAPNVSAGFSIAPGIAPSAPIDGDIWTTVIGVFARINGSTVGPFSSTGSTVPPVEQGDLLFGSAPSVISKLPKNTSATRYLANTGSSNNPAWAQIDLGTGVIGALPLANLPTGTLDTVLGYFTSTTQSAAALSNCTTALTYTTSTHTFGCNGGTGSGTVTSVGFLNTYGLNVSGTPITGSGNFSVGVTLASFTNSIPSNVALNNTLAYFDGPTIPQGSSGTWLAVGTVTLADAGAAAVFDCKMWDNASVIASGQAQTTGAGNITTMALSGLLTAPASNIRISCKDVTATTGFIISANSGNLRDSTITGVRIAQ